MTLSSQREAALMSSETLAELPRQYARLSVESLRLGLELEGETTSAYRRGDLAPQQYQVAMINLCTSIEAASKCIIAARCPGALFDFGAKSDKKRFTPRSLYRLGRADLSQAELTRMMMLHPVLGFRESLNVAKDLAPNLSYPIGVDILAEARNQAVHSLVADEHREADLVAIAALYMHRFLRNDDLLERIPTFPIEDERLDDFVALRRQSAEKAHQQLRRARLGIGQSCSEGRFTPNPDRYDDEDDNSEQAFAICPVCGARGRFELSLKPSARHPEHIILPTIWGSSAPMKFISPKSFYCPGCSLNLKDLEISESRQVFYRALQINQWETDKTPLSQAELEELWQAERDYHSE